MNRLAFLLRLLGTVCILSVASTCAFADTIVTDGDFDDWSSALVTDGGGGGGVVRHTTGGNPDVFLELWVWSPIHISTWVLTWKNDFVWDPSVDGPIGNVTLEVDEKGLNPGWVGQNMKLLVVQDGRYYGAPIDPWGTGTGDQTTWETLVRGPDGPLCESDFGECPPAEGFNPDETPDFSASGQPIRFGFMAGVTYMENARRHGYDNFKVTIVTGEPSSLESDTWSRIKVQYR